MCHSTFTGSGKSALLSRYVDDTYADSNTTGIGSDSRLVWEDCYGPIVRLQIWDIADKGITDRFGVTGIIFVYDVTNEESFVNIEKHLQSASPYARRILVGNKCDLEEDRMVTKERGLALADDWGIKFVETSAKSGTNVRQMFITIATEIMQRKMEKVKHQNMRIPHEGCA